MKQPKKAVRKAAEAREKAKAKKAVRAGGAAEGPPRIRILSEPQVPDILYKYTSDAGVAGLREGFVRFGSFEEYRQTEDEAIRDPYENSVVSCRVPIDFPNESKASLVLAMRLPGLVFCASADKALRGAFPPYNRRVAIRSGPFFRALGNAVTSYRHIFDAQTLIRDRKIAKAQFLESETFTTDKGQWHPTPPEKTFTAWLGMGWVHYVRDPHSKMSPMRMLAAAAIGGAPGGEILQKEIQADGFVKPFWFSHEKECRVMLLFLPKRGIPREGDPAYNTESIFVKVDNPRDIFILDDD